MLQARIRPLPRRPTANPPSSPSTSAPPPSFDTPSFDDDSDEDPEDLFGTFLPHLFPDDAPSFHGDPGKHLLYASPRYGDLTIMVPSYPGQNEYRSKEVEVGLLDENGVNKVDEGRKLFAHFLWSAGMVVAEGVEKAASDGDAGSDADMWRVKGERVLELGSGAGLPSIISALAQASAVTITDHPSSPALLEGGAVLSNIKYNIHPSSTCKINIRPHEWGTLGDDPWALETKSAYTRIIAADCYWMPSQHENLARTMKWFLAPGGAIWVVAAFHTGRPIVAGFFETAVKMGLSIETIFERDLNSSTDDGEEVRREWVSEREGEGLENRRRWCVVAVLRHEFDS
ncbi:hypothetical protein BJX99DRAFT_183760 [Aspergillus californicus]